jgi:pentatricopeptide repeat protein
VITYSTVISTCEKGKHPKKALELYGEMLQMGLAPNVTTYRAAISKCEKGMHLLMALVLPGEMQ